MKLENYCCLSKSSYELMIHVIGLFFEYPDRPMFDKIKPGPFDVRYKVRPDRPKPEKTGVRPSLLPSIATLHLRWPAARPVATTRTF